MKKNLIKYFLIFCVGLFFLTQASFAEEKPGVLKTLWQKTLSTFRNPVKELTPLPKMLKESNPKPKDDPLQNAESKPSIDKRTKRPPLAEISEKELRERITYMIGTMPAVLDFIPELKATTDEEGNASDVRYKIQGVWQDLGTLDKETLIKIHSRLSSERTRLQTERIQRQLESVRAAQNISRQPQIFTPPTAPVVPTPPPAPPRVYTTPQVPQVPNKVIIPPQVPQRR